MKNMNYWFYLETYTYLSSDEYNVLLYNTLSGKFFRIEAGHVLGKLLKEYEGGDRKCLELTDDAFPSSLSMLDIWIQQIKYCSLDCVIKFLIPSEESLVLAESRMENEAVENYQIVPYYNGDNIEFFKQFIYLDEEDILSARLDKQAIFRNQVLNSYDFGKINIFSDGDIYANLNFEKLGNVGVDSIADIICEELTSGKSWLRVRSEKPCCDCLYQWLCPSPSNYELAIGKTDLCNKS